MKIENGAAQQAYAAYRNAAGSARAVSGAPQQQGADAEASPVSRSDRADISAQGQARANALNAVRNAPDTRPELVAQLNAQVKAGTYKVDNNQLAQKLAAHIDLRS